jgi:P-type Cu+ transporter
MKVVSALGLSKLAFSKIKQNLFFAIFYRDVVIPVVIVGFLYHVVTEVAMALSSITVVTNANLLQRAKV